MSRPLAAIIGLWLLNLALALIGGVFQSRHETTLRVESTRNLLRRIERESSPARFFEKRCRRVIKDILGQPLSPAVSKTLSDWRQHLPGVRVEVLLFGSGNVLLSPERYGLSSDPSLRPGHPAGTEQAGMAARFQAGFSDLQFPLKDRPGIRIEWPDQRFADLNLRSQGRPGRFYSWERSPQETGMGIWDVRHGVGENQVAGILILLTSKREMRTSILSFLLNKIRNTNRDVGCFDPGLTRRLFRPPSVSEATFHQLMETYTHSGETIIPCGPDLMVFHPGIDTEVLVGRVSTVSPRMQPHLLFLSFLWPPLLVRFTLNGFRRKPPLALFLPGLLFGAVLVPIAISVLFWVHLEETRERALLNQSGHQLLERLVTLDRRFPTILQHSNHRYRDWVLKFQKAWLQQPTPFTIRKGPKVNQFFADFPPKSPFTPLIEVTKTWERGRNFDTFVLVSSAGVFLREFCLDKSCDRKMIHIPLPQRFSFLECVTDRGTGFSHQDFQGLSTRNDSDYSWDDWIQVGDSLQETPLRLAADLFREAARRDNASFRSGISQGHQQNHLITFALDSLEGLRGINFSRWLKFANGEIVPFRDGHTTDYIRMEAIKDASGAVQFYTVFCHWATTLEQFFLEAFFRSSDRASPGIRYWAIAQDTKARHFPQPFLHRFFQPRLNAVKSPKIGQVEMVTDRSGRPRLLALLKCPNLQNFALAATADLGGIHHQRAQLRFRLLVLSIAMGILLMTIAFRLFQGIILPARALAGGITAMEQHSYHHLINIPTGDEWEQLGGIFNQALAKMAELEVAQIVQQKLMPQAPVETTGLVFYGQTVMMSAIGGDYFDAIVSEDGRLAFIIGDVSGHGVPAALVTAIAKSGFSSFIHDGERSPAQLIQRLNDLLFRILKKRRMMTCLLGIADPDGRVTLANAGNLAPLPFPEQEPENFPRDEDLVGFPLGLRSRLSPKEFSFPLGSGNSIVFFSDGLVEATNPEGRVFHIHGVRQALKEIPGGANSTATIVPFLQERLRKFTNGQPRQDDVTVAVLTRR
jgi:hypothetical protein